MHTFEFAVAAFSAIILTVAAQETSAQDAGAIQELSGTVMIMGADRTTRRAGPRARIRSGDTIPTEGKSEAVIKMADDSSVILRQNTQFQFTDFRFENKPTDSALSAIIRGTARMISGLVGKNYPTQVAVRASTATIGIRGTDFEVAVITEDTPEGRAGVYNFTRDGATNIRIASGQNLDVRKEQTAFAPEKPNPGEEPLQLLRDRPVFLQQGGGLDALIQSLTIPAPMMIR